MIKPTYEELKKRIKELEKSEKLYKKTAEDLLESEERYRDLVEKAGIAISIEDKDGKFIYVNENNANLYGYTIAEMMKQSINTLVHPDDLQMVMKRHRDRLKGKTAPSTYEIRGIKKDGTVINIDVHSNVLKENDKVIGTRTYLWDITARKKAEELLKDSQQLLESIFNAIPDLLTVHDKELRILMSNWKGHDYIPLEKRQGNPNCYDCYMNRDVPCEPCHALEVFKTGKVTRLEKENLIDKITREINVFPIFDETGKVTMVAEHIRDITERKQAEKLIKIQRDLGITFGTVRDLNTAIEITLNAALKLEEIDGGGIYLVDEITGNLNLYYHEGLGNDFIEKVSSYDSESSNAQLVMKGDPVFRKYEHIEKNYDDVAQKEAIKASAVIPIKYEGKVIGALNLASHTVDQFSMNIQRTVETFASQIGDVIVRIRAEEALRESEERYRRLLELSFDGILIHSEGKVVFINRTGAKLFGANSLNELIGKHIMDFIHPEYRKSFKVDNSK